MLTLIRRALLLLIAVVSCACSAPVKQDQISSAHYTDPEDAVAAAPEVDEVPDYAGYAEMVDCSLYQRAPLVLDPTWDEQTAEYLRSAAQWWEDAVGVDLGDLPYAETDCSRQAPVAGCIMALDAMADGDEDLPGVIIYVERLISYDGGSWPLLELVTAHEIGHYLGVGHIPSGVMQRELTEVYRGLTDADILAYETACVD